MARRPGWPQSPVPQTGGKGRASEQVEHRCPGSISEQNAGGAVSGVQQAASELPQPTTRAYWPPRVIKQAPGSGGCIQKPEQAALTSRVGIFSRRASRLHPAGHTGAASGAERVAQMQQPISAGDRPLRSSACFAAEMARVEADSSGRNQCRIRMPVRLTIHSSLVSTVRLRSSLVTVRLGSARRWRSVANPPCFLVSPDLTEFFVTLLCQGLCRPSGPVQPAGGAAQGRCFGTMLGGRAAHPKGSGITSSTMPASARSCAVSFITSQASLLREASFHKMLANPSGLSTE